MLAARRKPAAARIPRRGSVAAPARPLEIPATEGRLSPRELVRLPRIGRDRGEPACFSYAQRGAQYVWEIGPKTEGNDLSWLEVSGTALTVLETGIDAIRQEAMRSVHNMAAATGRISGPLTCRGQFLPTQVDLRVCS